jgi:hypothetical protein
MAVKSVRKKTPKKSKKADKTSPLLNGIIAGLTLVILLFIYSLLQKQQPVPKETDLAYSALETIPTAILLDQEKKKDEVNLRVEILNGCGVNGLASKTKHALNRMGVDVLSTGNAPNHNYRRTLIYVHGDNIDKALKFAKMTGITTDPVIDGYKTSIPCDLTIILGSDYTELSIF